MSCMVLLIYLHDCMVFSQVLYGLYGLFFFPRDSVMFLEHILNRIHVWFC